MSAPPLSLKGRAVQWLSQREHSRQELRRKLLTHLRNAARREAARADAARAAAGAEPASLGERRGAAAVQALSTETLDRDPGDPGDPGDTAAAWAAQVEEVLDWLTAQRYLSEARFVESRLHARGARYGNLRIKQELAQHGVSLSADQSQQLQATEHERALSVWSRKFGAAPADLRERAKQMRFLAARGFSMPAIQRVLRQAGAPVDDHAADGDRGDD